MGIIDENIITEFMRWKISNKDSFTSWSYVNLKSDIQLALGFANFFTPELIEIENCIFLKDHYDEKIYNGWKESLGGNKTKIEMTMNYYEVADFFHINTNYDDINIDEQVDALAKALQHFWSLSFSYFYPNKNIRVIIFEENDSTCITVYEEID